MIIEKLTSGPFETNTYIFGCSKTKQVCIVDVPPDSAEKLVKKIEQLDLFPVRILLTHSHQDHIADAALLKSLLQIPLFIHRLDAENLRHPGQDGLPLYFPVGAVEPDSFLEDGDVFFVGELEVHVLLTPGHTPGGICFYVPKEATLFSGDTLFKNSMGRIDFPQSNASQMWDSLRKLSKLPEETRVFPGHGPSTQIGKEGWMKTAQDRFG